MDISLKIMWAAIVVMFFILLLIGIVKDENLPEWVMLSIFIPLFISALTAGTAGLFSAMIAIWG